MLNFKADIDASHSQSTEPALELSSWNDYFDGSFIQKQSHASSIVSDPRSSQALRRSWQASRLFRVS